MLRVLAALAAIMVGVTAVWAQNAAGITARRDAMKAFGGAFKEPNAMNKGEAPFDLPKIQASLVKLQETATKAKGLFGDDTKVGETDTLPAAFENKADLLDRFDKLAAAAKAAATAVKDEASLKAEWPKVAGNCGGCHKAYRKPPPAK
jgi:cytochrome c556